MYTISVQNEHTKLDVLTCCVYLGFMEVNVFHFTDPKEFLAAALAAKQKQNPRFSLRAWAKQLGYENPSSLSAILRGKRPIQLELARKIAKHLKADAQEIRYLELITLIKNSRSPGEKEFHAQTLATLCPGQEVFNLEVEKFRLISDWYHFVLLEMLNIKKSPIAPKELATCLEPEVNSTLVEAAFKRMERLGLIKKIRSGKYKKLKKDYKTGDEGISEAVQAHHHQMLENTKQALDNQKLEERDFRGTTLAVRLSDLPKLKKLILNFHDQINQLSAEIGGDEVYRFSTQLFRLTQFKKMKRSKG